MPIYKLIIEYDGSRFRGIQKQAKLKDRHGLGVKIRTVQEELERAIFLAFGDKARGFDFCGRTDSGVSAVGQVCHLWHDDTFLRNRLSMAINHHLQKIGPEWRLAPSGGVGASDCGVGLDSDGNRVSGLELGNLDLRVIGDEIVSDDFHSRFSCKYRVYQYKILNRFFASPVLFGRAWHVNKKIDIEVAKDVAKIFMGHHDFSAFRAVGCTASSPERTLDSVEVFCKPFGSALPDSGGLLSDIIPDNDKSIGDDFSEMITLQFVARSFLYKMVRRISGAIVDVSIGRRSAEQAREALDGRAASCDFVCAPACGLYFVKAIY